MSEFIEFLQIHKKLWIFPIVAMLAWLVVLLALQDPSVGTFEYRMF